jgi:hypothetical protein
MNSFDIKLQNGLKGRGRRASWFAAAVIALASATAANAALPLKTIEECHETGTRAVSLPGVAGGTLSASTCVGCPTLRLQFDAKTRYFIGKEQVSYTKLREAAAKGDLRLDLFYEPNSRTLSRLRLAAAGGAQ